MKISPARIPPTSIRHFSPPGPLPFPCVPATDISCTSLGETFAAAIFGLTIRGFGVSLAGRLRLGKLERVGVTGFSLDQPANAGQQVARTLPGRILGSTQ